jgi:DNA replication and repair protein RecF
MKGYTSVGPHKADVKIKVDGYSASESLSRGQLRVLMASIQLAQTQHLKEEKDRQSIFLLDDVGAELDAIKRRVFIDLLLECDAQIFVTAIDRAQFTLPSNCSTMKVFHVEHGQVTEELT